MFPKLFQIIFIAVASILVVFLIVQAGSLSPSASPTGTMNTLEDIYNSIAGTFNSSAISASSTGSLIQNLKYISNNLFWSSSGNNIYNLNSGNIGIGTTTPAYALVASGTIQMTGFRMPTGATNSYVLTSDANGAGTWQAASGGISGSGTANYLAKFSTSTSLTNSIIFEYATSSIGIGTSTPVSTLELYSTTSTQLTITSATSSDPILGFRTGAAPATRFLFGVDQSDSNKFKIATSTIDTNTILTVDQSGNVGVNNPSPTEKLTVTGNIANLASTSFNPVLKSTLTGLSNPTGIYVVGKYAYITNYTNDTLQIIDVSNPSSPASVGSILDAATGSDPQEVYISGRYAYIANFNAASIYEYSSLAIIDISNPSLPSGTASANTIISFGGTSDVQVAGRFAYVTNYNNSTLQIFDISNAASSSPVSVGSVNTNANPSSLYISGRYVYVVNFTASTLQVIDVSNPFSPSIAGSINTSSTPNSVFVSGRYAYVGNSGANNLQIFDVSNPSSPSFVGSIGTNDTKEVFVSGRYAYVINYANDTLEVIDVFNPASPVSVGSVATGDGPGPLFVVGRYVYVLNSTDNSLQIFDVSGIETTSAIVHSLETGVLNIGTNAVIGGNLNVVGGINIGAGGLFSAGDIGLRGDLYADGNTKANIILSGSGNDTVYTTTVNPAIRRQIGGGMGLDSPTSIIVNLDADNNGTTGVFTVRSNASTTNLFAVSETGRFDITSAASSTIYVGSATKTGCLVLGDSDGSGVSYITASDGVLATTSTKPSICE